MVGPRGATRAGNAGDGADAASGDGAVAEDVAEAPSCPICLTSMAPADRAVTGCMHTFCRSCLGSWLQLKRLCPLCKRRVHVYLTDIVDDATFTEVLVPPSPLRPHTPPPPALSMGTAAAAFASAAASAAAAILAGAAGQGDARWRGRALWEEGPQQRWRRGEERALFDNAGGGGRGGGAGSETDGDGGSPDVGEEAPEGAAGGAGGGRGARGGGALAARRVLQREDDAAELLWHLHRIADRLGEADYPAGRDGVAGAPRFRAASSNATAPGGALSSRPGSSRTRAQPQRQEQPQPRPYFFRLQQRLAAASAATAGGGAASSGPRSGLLDAWPYGDGGGAEGDGGREAARARAAAAAAPPAHMSQRDELLGADGRQQPEAQQLSVSAAALAAAAALASRRQVYDAGLWAARVVPGGPGSSGAARGRWGASRTRAEQLEEWVARDLRALLHTTDLTLLRALVLGLVRTYGLERDYGTAEEEQQLRTQQPEPSVSRGAAVGRPASALDSGGGDGGGGSGGPIAALRPFLLDRAAHFWHELRSFARSGLAMDAYDRAVRYGTPAPQPPVRGAEPAPAAPPTAAAAGAAAAAGGAPTTRSVPLRPRPLSGPRLALSSIPLAGRRAAMPAVVLGAGGGGTGTDVSAAGAGAPVVCGPQSAGGGGASRDGAHAAGAAPLPPLGSEGAHVPGEQRRRRWDVRAAGAAPCGQATSPAAAAAAAAAGAGAGGADALSLAAEALAGRPPHASGWHASGGHGVSAAGRGGGECAPAASTEHGDAANAHGHGSAGPSARGDGGLRGAAASQEGATAGRQSGPDAGPLQRKRGRSRSPSGGCGRRRVRRTRSRGRRRAERSGSRSRSPPRGSSRARGSGRERSSDRGRGRSPEVLQVAPSTAHPSSHDAYAERKRGADAHQQRMQRSAHDGVPSRTDGGAGVSAQGSHRRRRSSSGLHRRLDAVGRGRGGRAESGGGSGDRWQLELPPELC